MCVSLAVSALKYIHWPSGDHAASVHCDGIGPTGFPVEPRSNGINRHGSHEWMSISTESIHRPSGERYDRCAMPSGGGGPYTVRAPVRVSLDATIDIWPPMPVISENSTRRRPPESVNQVMP